MPEQTDTSHLIASHNVQILWGLVIVCATFTTPINERKDHAFLMA